MDHRLKLVEINFAYGENIDLFFRDANTNTLFCAFLSNDGFLYSIVDYSNGVAKAAIDPRIISELEEIIRNIDLEDIKNKSFKDVHYRDS